MNGDFSQGTTNWVLNLIAPAVATANVVNGVYEVNVTTPSTTTWYVYPQQAPFTMTQGVNYKLSFDVWADNANVMDYYLGKNYGDMGNYFNQYGLSVTSTKQTFTYNLTMTLPTDNNCRLVFAVAKFTGKVYLDNVHLTKVVPTINLSLNQPTTASTQASTTYTPAKAVDGNASTQWRCSTSDPNPWIYVDLGSNCSFDRVKLDWSTYYAKAYLIQSSTDAVNWTTVSTLTAQNGGTDDNINLTGQGRYVRIYVTTKSNTRGVYLINFEVYGNTSLKSAHITGQSPLSTVNVKNVDVKVFPNPVLNNLTIENAGNIERIEICSLTGQVIIKSIHSGNKANVDLSGLSSGLYVLKVYQQNKVTNTFKIIKK